MQEEIFGPVCSIAKFKTEEDAIKVGNSTTYGLAAAVHTSNLNTAIRVSNSLRAGTVWVYVLPPFTPFVRTDLIQKLISCSQQLLQLAPPPTSFRWIQGVGHWTRIG